MIAKRLARLLGLTVCLLVPGLLAGVAQNKKDDKMAVEPFKVERLTQGMGLYALAQVSPDGRSLLLLAQKPEQSPNLYVMTLGDRSIRQITNLPWGVADPVWSPDSQSVAFAGFNESGSFAEIYTLEVKTLRARQLTRNSFADREPLFLPDGKRLLYATDASPLPEAAFGILHVESVAVTGGKAEYFTDDEASTTHPRLSPDGQSVLLIKIDEDSGRHSLWQYGFDGKDGRDLTGRRLARIRRVVASGAGSFVALWAQEQPEQQDEVFVLDWQTRELKPLPEPDLPKLSPVVSPDGRRIAFIAPAGDGTQLFLFDRASGQVQQLTSKGAATFTPVFISNDQILFGSDRDRAREIYLLDLSVPNSDEKKK